MDPREAVNELPPGESWPQCKAQIPVGEKEAPPGTGSRVGGMAETRQGLRTKSDFELDLKSSSEQGPNSHLRPRQNLGCRPDLNSGHRLDQNTTVGRLRIKPVRKNTPNGPLDTRLLESQGWKEGLCTCPWSEGGGESTWVSCGSGGDPGM